MRFNRLSLLCLMLIFSLPVWPQTKPSLERLKTKACKIRQRAGV